MLLLSLLAAASARALTLEPIGTFDQPIYVTSDPGDSNRLFVVERGGKVELVQGGGVSTFADLSSVVNCPSSCMDTTERGLLSMALAPDFDTTGHFYVDYAAGDTGAIHVDELTANGNSASLSTRRSLLAISHSDTASHNGGQLQFGPDGDLYISTGDGGGVNDQFKNAQDLTKPLGKILRIHPNPDGPAPYYTVPSDNPFAGVVGDYAPIWSYGLRNPFRFSFDRLSGDMVIGDVGQSGREEVDYAPFPTLGMGANYGWNCREGLIAGSVADDPGCSTAPPGAFVDPVFDYPHTPDPDVGGADRCAIIDGYVVRDPSLGSLDGRYLYADLCSGELRSLALKDPFATDRSESLHVDNPNSFGEDSCGRVYVASGDGPVYRIQGAAPASCPPDQGLNTTGNTYVRIHAQRRTVQRGRTAFITVWVSPCVHREGRPVRLFRGRKRVGTKSLDRACAAHFYPRVPHRSTFTAFSPGNADFLPATSRHLTIRAGHRVRQRSP